MTGRWPGVVRPARDDDLPACQEIERAAGRLFAPLGMTLVAEDDPPSMAELRVYQRGGGAWVRTDGNDRPVASLLAEVALQKARPTRTNTARGGGAQPIPARPVRRRAVGRVDNEARPDVCSL